jgi:hypothetical protein
MYCGVDQTIKIKLDAAHTTNALPWSATAVSAAAIPTAANGTTNGTTDVIVVGATTGLLKLLLLRNADTVAHNLSMIYDDNGTQRLIAKITLGVNEHMEYNSQSGIRVYDATGALKQAYAGIVAVAFGGTGATTAATARANLGVVDGSDNMLLPILLPADKRASVTPKTVASSSNHVAINLANGNSFMCNLNENTTLDNPTGLVAGQAFTIYFKQNGGSKTIAYGSKFKFPSKTVPSASTDDNALDALVCETYTDPDDSLVYILADLRKDIG